MKFIELTYYDETTMERRKIRVNAEHIVLFSPSGEYTSIDTVVGGGYVVTEAYDRIMEMINGVT